MPIVRALYRRCHAGVLQALNALGLNVARASDYYSPLPLRSHLARSRERWDRPSDMVGIDYDLEGMKDLLRSLLRAHGEEASLPDYENAKQRGYGPGFTSVDALVLYLMMRDLQPSRYIEIGSGLSTYYAWSAAVVNRESGSPCEITCIDPYAGRQLEQLDGVTVDRRPIQDVPLEIFESLGENDVIFIDSTHVVKLDGDVPRLYLEVLPRLRPGVVIHSHDIHFPYNVPHPAEQYLFRAKWPMFWTEAMLLQAFLSFNPSYRIEMSTPLLRFHDDDFLAETLPDYRRTEPGDYDTHHGSLWYRKLPTDRGWVPERAVAIQDRLGSTLGAN